MSAITMFVAAVPTAIAPGIHLFWPWLSAYHHAVMPAATPTTAAGSLRDFDERGAHLALCGEASFYPPCGCPTWDGQAGPAPAGGRARGPHSSARLTIMSTWSSRYIRAFEQDIGTKDGAVASRA